MEEQKDNQEHEYGGLETLSGKEKGQLFVSMMMVVLAMLAFYLKIYFF